MPGDWPCPNEACINHAKLVFGKRESCPSCGAAKHAQTPGDWLCPNGACVNSKNCVFGRKAACPKCGAPRPGGGHGKGQMTMPQQGYGVVMGGCGGCCGGGQHGDWPCPNPSCMNSQKGVFGRHSACPSCGAPKPAQGMGGCGSCGGCGGCGGCTGYGGCSGYGSCGGVIHLPVGGALAGQQGDWQCPNPSCMNSRKGVFAKHNTCPKCGSDKPMVQQSYGFGPGAGGQSADWPCPNSQCLNHHKLVFGKHETCPKCGAGKYEIRGRNVARAGDWTCPNTECQNSRKGVFGKHTSCPACGADKPVVASDRSRSPSRTF